MKEFHPAAVSINEQGEHIHYLLRPAEEGIKRGKPSPDPLLVVDPATFEQYVRDNRVQLFMDNGDGPQNVHTPGELKAFRKMFKKVGGAPNSEDYWRSEVTFLDNVISVPGAINISLVLARVMDILKQTVVTGAVYSRGMTPSLREYIKKHSLVMATTSPDMVTCNWALSQFIDFIKAMKDNPLTVCMDTMKHLDNTLYRIKMMGFRNVTEGELQRVVDQVSWVLPPVPEAPTTSQSATDYIVSACETVQIPPAVQEYYNFYRMHRERLMRMQINGSVGAPKVAAVVTCVPKEYMSSYMTVGELTTAIRETGWPAASTSSLCGTANMGIVLLDGWPVDAIHTLGEIARSCSVGRITSIHVFGAESGEFLDSVEFTSDGDAICAAETPIAPGVKPMSLQ